MEKKAAVYTTGSIPRRMLKTAAAMVPATLALCGYNLADTYFVGKLPGVYPLAAMGFTLPVIMLVGCLFRGLAIGVMTTCAQALGAGKQGRASRLVSGGALLILCFSIVLAVLGMLFSKPLFVLFGAEGETLRLVESYMNIWFFGCATASLSMTGNDLLIASGDSKLASMTMILGLVTNVILDPLCIFGWKFIPALGIAGAALATIFSQCIGAVIAMCILHFRHHLLEFRRIPADVLFKSWGLMLRYAGPSVLGMLMMPLGISVMTRITASFGDVAVAAVAAAGRLEMAAFVIPMSLGMSLMPFAGQNYGAKLYDRICEGRRFSMRFALFFLTGAAIIFALFADQIVVVFKDDPEICRIMALCLRITSWGFAGVEIHRFAGFFYTGCGKPSASAWLNALRILGLLIPLSLLALYFKWLTGLFFARLIADVLSAVIGYTLVRRMTNRLRDDARLQAAAGK